MEQYQQFRAVNKGKDTSPQAFLVYRGQQAAYEKLEQIVQWAEENREYITASAMEELEAILN